MNAKTRGASADTQPQPETPVADQQQRTKTARTAHPEKEQADKDRLEKKRTEPAGSPPSQNVGKAKRRKLPMSKDSGKRKRSESSSKPHTSSGEYSAARLPAMQPTLSGNEILTRAALQLAADWDIDHPRSEDGVRRMAMEQMAIGARVRSLRDVIH